MTLYESNLSGLIFADSDSIERNLKETEYYDYIILHRENVKKAFGMYFAPLLTQTIALSTVGEDDLKAAIRECGENMIPIHDESKFSDDEFPGYRAHWYPTENEKSYSAEYQTKVEEEYAAAWDHHRFGNKHHPDYWVDKETGEAIDMELPAIVEMICDWEGVSLQFNGDICKWYTDEAKDEKACMTDNTREIVEDILFNLLHKGTN